MFDIILNHLILVLFSAHHSRPTSCSLHQLCATVLLLGDTIRILFAEAWLIILPWSGRLQSLWLDEATFCAAKDTRRLSSELFLLISYFISDREWDMVCSGSRHTLPLLICIFEGD